MADIKNYELLPCKYFVFSRVPFVHPIVFVFVSPDRFMTCMGEG